MTTSEPEAAVLLDANVLIALVVEDHVHHDAAERWLTSTASPFATCPVTQGALVRFLVREGVPASTAVATITGVASDPRHRFVADDVPFDAVDVRPVVGHRQVTDAYLAALARAHATRLVTFDGGLAAAHPDVVTLLDA
jgi:toxin-antitoxin system PIN domain toxin